MRTNQGRAVTEALPIVHQISWPATIPQFGALAASIGFFWLVVGQLRSAMIAGALLYLGYSYGSRALLLRHHQSGMRAMHAGRYEEG